MAPLHPSLSQAPSPPCAHCATICRLAKPEKKPGSAVAGGGFPDLACLPSYPGSALRHPAQLTRHKPERAPWPTTASDDYQKHPNTSSGTKAAATAQICLDKQHVPLPGAVPCSCWVIWCYCYFSGKYLSFHLVSVNTLRCGQGSPRSKLCFCTGEQPRDGAGCGSGAAPTSTAELRCSVRSKPFLPARLSRLLQEMVEIISGVPLEIVLCS